MAGNEVRVKASVDDKVSPALDQIKNKFGALGKGIAGDSTFGKGIGLAAGVAAFNVLHGAVDAVGGAIGGAIGGAAQFEKGMLNVNSIAKLSSGELAAMGDKVLKLSGSFGQSQQALTSALYDINSSGFAGAKAFDILQASAMSATAGLSDAGTAAKGITAVLNSYGMKAEDAAHVSDVMFQTVNRGVVTFEELSSEIGKTTALASPLGISLEEVGAGLSVMTRHGIDAENATTQLNAIMSSVLQPSGQAADLAHDLGIEWNTAGLKAKGLSGFLADMIAKTGGSQEQMATLLGDVRAIRGAFTLGADAGKEFTDELGQFNNVAGVTDEVLGIQKQGLAFKAAQAEQKFNALATTLGQKAIPALSELLYVVDRTQIPFEKMQEAAARGSQGAMAQFRQLEAAAQELGLGVEETWALMGEAGTQNVDDLRGWRRNTVDQLDHAERSYHDLGKSGSKDLKALGNAAGKAGDKTTSALQDIIDKANETQKELASLADEAIGDYFDPIINQDRLMAGEAEVAAHRRIVASKKATAAEKADAKAALHQLDRDNTNLRIKLFEAGKLSRHEQGVLLADLTRDWKSATGSAKAEIAGLIAKIQTLQTSSGVSITVSGGSGGKKRRAAGGPVAMNDAYLVGEEGPELFVPSTAGTILTHSQSRAAMTGGGTSSSGHPHVVQLVIDARGMREIARVVFDEETHVRRLGTFSPG